MLVSVIIPNYNYSKYILQCIQSVLNSDVNQDEIEIIVVDDSSSDDSVKVIEEIMKFSNFQIKLIKNEINLGLTLSRNRGISYAQGEFLFFLDSDNFIRKDCINTHVAFMQQNPSAIACYAPIQDFLSNTGEFLEMRSNKIFDYQLLLEGPYIDAMAMFRKFELIEIGMFDNKMPPYGWEDYELWLRLGKMKKNVIFIQGEPLSFYRKHKLNMSQNFKPDQYNHLIYYLKQKYSNINVLNHSETIDSLIYENNKYVQLYYKKPYSEYTENQSIKTNIKQNNNKISFKFKQALLVNQLRLDPLNDYAKIRIINIQILLKGISLEAYTKLTSNAFKFENNVYLFDTTDPQIFIDFPNNHIIEIDEISIEIEYMQIGNNAIPEILLQKDLDFKQSLNINHDELKKIKNELHFKKEELQQKNKELQQMNEELNNIKNELNKKNDQLNQMYASRSWKLTKPIRLLLKLFLINKSIN